MKKVVFIVALVLLQIGLFAQNYQQAMGTALGNFGKAATVEQLQQVAAEFSRIAEVETSEWLPSYYASLIYSIIVFRTQDAQMKTNFAEKAQEMADKAMAIAPNESEVQTLQGMVYQAFMVIDPGKNYQLYSSKMNGAFQMAIKLNPENPRPYYLQGVSTMHVPEQFGGGKAAAKPLFETAMQKFNSYEATNPFYPNWGKEDCEKNLALCSTETSQQ